MEYISHVDYKKMMENFKKGAPKQSLNESWRSDPTDEEGEEHSLAIEKELEDLAKAGKIDQQTLNKALDYVNDHDYELSAHNLDAGYVLKQVAGVEEGNAFTAGLAKAKKGQSFKVGGKTVKDTSNYDASLEEDENEDEKETYETTQDFLDHVFDILNDEMRAPQGHLSAKGLNKADAYLTKHGEKLAKSGKSAQDVADALITKFVGLEEYQFDQMYPDDPGPFEGKDEMEETIKEFLARESAVDWERVDDEEAESDETDNGIEEDMEEGLNAAPFQATGPTIQTVEGKGSKLAHLTVEERDQLRQYVETIKTVKEQIRKMVDGCAVEEGGDNTNLIMKTSKMSENSEEE